MYPIAWALGEYDSHISGNTYSLKYADGNSLVVTNGDQVKNWWIQVVVWTEITSAHGQPIASGYSVKVMAEDGAFFDLFLWFDNPYLNGPPFDGWRLIIDDARMQPGVWYTFASYSEHPWHVVSGWPHRMNMLIQFYPGVYDSYCHIDRAITYVTL